MKKKILLLLLILGSFPSFSQNSSLIPVPVKKQDKMGEFHVPKTWVIDSPQSRTFQKTNQDLKEFLEKNTYSSVQFQGNANLILSINSEMKNPEAYELIVSTDKIQINASTEKGLFYGIQTLYQLLPPQYESNNSFYDTSIKIKNTEIEDYPRFEWRGMMLDVARHFFTVEQVKDFIDEIARLKYNKLHWHLTDDEGWRVEIKSYPNLTQKGAFNVFKIGQFTTFSDPKPNEPRNFGGYYTQDQIKEVVAYAQSKFVEIIPEIDVPGHSMAAVASYPELSCTIGADKYEVISGEVFIDWSTGHPRALKDNTLCPANPKVYEFLDKVIGELAELFPSQYIHTGGDECPKNYWEKNPQILAMMKKENLKNPQEVQAFFTRKLQKIVSSKGKKMMGWDEILEGGGLPKDVAVMSWRGIKGGIEASNNGHKVVMSPNNHVYVDLMQGSKYIEPPVYNTVRLKDSYAFNPVPEGVAAENVMGGQANLWSEQLFNYRHLQYMIYPRIFAVAESVWSPDNQKNWNDFVERVEDQMVRLDQANIKFAPSMYEPIIDTGLTEDGKNWIQFSPEINDLEFHYSLDFSYPDEFYPASQEKIVLPIDVKLVRVQSYRYGKKVGRTINVPINK
jgi:hexosaminidase